MLLLNISLGFERSGRAKARAGFIRRGEESPSGTRRVGLLHWSARQPRQAPGQHRQRARMPPTIEIAVNALSASWTCNAQWRVFIDVILRLRFELQRAAAILVSSQRFASTMEVARRRFTARSSSLFSRRRRVRPRRRLHERRTLQSRTSVGTRMGWMTSERGTRLASRYCIDS